MQRLIKVSDETALALARAIHELSEECRLALELNGLKAKAIKARSAFDRLNAAYDKLNEAAPAHAADVEGLATQLGAMQDDLSFAVTTLGNSVGEQEKPVDKPKETVTVTRADIGKLEDVLPAAPVTTDPPAIWARL